MNRLLLSLTFSLVWLYSYGQKIQECSLYYYIETAKENSPLITDYRNQTEIEQAELKRLKAMYTHSRLEPERRLSVRAGYLEGRWTNRLQMECAVGYGLLRLRFGREQWIFPCRSDLDAAPFG